MYRVPTVLFTMLLLVILAIQAPLAETAGELDPLTEARVNKVKASIHELQIAIERFGIDNEFGGPEGFSTYPHSVSQLVIPYGDYGSYAEPGFYHNPYQPGAEAELNARCVPFGWSEDAVGNFTYLAHYNNVGHVVCYMLILWGPEPDAGWDMDGDGKGEGQMVTLASGAQQAWSGSMLFHDNGRAITLKMTAED